MLKWHERYSVGRSLLIQKQAFGGKNMICGPSRVTAVVFSHEMTICPPSPFLPPEISKIVASERSFGREVIKKATPRLKYSLHTFSLGVWLLCFIQVFSRVKL